MAPSSKKQNSQTSGGSSNQHDGQQSYALREYLRAGPTITERISGTDWAGESGKGKEKHHEDKAKDALKQFEDDWRGARK